ncbi:hypothetical protein [Cronobacter dublinensis]|uniref:hypothetical protein n=1 Tax=Cronobacter dublinensis TaxID=413497 RepID=UPI001319D56B|nr:hypothetical protein [Cronobacter dublinensis]MDT3607510.1 hypothetical protein [Cronobacter dublinensis]
MWRFQREILIKKQIKSVNYVKICHGERREISSGSSKEKRTKQPLWRVNIRGEEQTSRESGWRFHREISAEKDTIPAAYR